MKIEFPLPTCGKSRINTQKGMSLAEYFYPVDDKDLVPWRTILRDYWQHGAFLGGGSGSLKGGWTSSLRFSQFCYQDILNASLFSTL